MPLSRILRGARNFRRVMTLFWNSRYQQKYDLQLSMTQIKVHFPDRNSVYSYMHHFFHHSLPEHLRNHREYFKQDNRGFGEDAFHSLWYFIFKEIKPKKVLEIGVYRGQILSLWMLLSNILQLATEIHGISPLSPAGDEATNYPDLDYLQDIKNNFSYFALPLPHLHKGYSTDNNIVQFILSKKWDLIYVDGNHNYEIVKHDFDISSSSLKEHGLIILDDSAKFTDFKAPLYAFAGHEGPSRVASEIDRKTFQEIIGVGHNRVFQRTY